MILPSNTRVYIAIGNVDMRKAISGLSSLVSGLFQHNPFTGHFYAFSNKRKNIVKILYWDNNGFCLWQKRLEKNRFKWPKSKNEVLEISSRELNWLIDGLDIQNIKGHKKIKYTMLY